MTGDARTDERPSQPVEDAKTQPVGVETLAGFITLAVPALALVGLGIAGAVTTGATGMPGRVGLDTPSIDNGVATITLVVTTVTLAIAAVALVGTLAALVTGIRAEWWALRASLARAAAAGTASRERFDPSEAVPVGAALVAGALVTYGLAVEAGVQPVVGAGAVGVVAAVAVPTRAVPAYCGAFVGMTSPAVLDTYVSTAAAAAVAALLFLAARPVYHGVGGKLGTTAFVGVVLTAIVASRSFPGGSIPGPELAAVAVVAGGVAAAVTFAIHARLGASSVLASGAVGLVGGIAAPAALGADGGLVAAVVFAASFAGMTEPARIPDERWLAVTGVVVGVLVVFTMPYLSGSGGKLGTIAFGSSLAVHGGLRAAHLVRFRQRLDAEARDTT